MVRSKPLGESIWEATVEMPTYPPLTADVEASVCVVGAGIAGLSAAYHLAKAGKKVVVIDDGPIAGGETQVTTAHLSNLLDCRYVEIERLHGVAGSQLIAESHTTAIDRIEAIVAAEKIDCDFHRVDGFLFRAPDSPESVLEEELEAVHRAGMKDVEWAARAPLLQFETGRCLRFPRQGQFHPLKYLAALAKAIVRDGGQIYTGTHAANVEGGYPAHVTTSAGPVITADEVVVATNTPVNDLLAIHTKQAPYMTYVIGARIPKDSVPTALFWDTADPFHYVRIQPGAATAGQAPFDLLIVGGEDHKTGQAQDGAERLDRLESWARERFPMIQTVESQWAGQVLETMDGIAFIGRNPLDADNIYIATGDSGLGMTHGTIAGMLITDLIVGRENLWEKIYDPTRKTTAAAGDFASENLNVAARYADWLTPGEVNSVDEILPGQGAILRRGLSKVAVYRNELGYLAERSAVCPHLGCVVAWNATESTWDCPCHGSRFSPEGKVVNGPANTDLARTDDK